MNANMYRNKVITSSVKNFSDRTRRIQPRDVGSVFGPVPGFLLGNGAEDVFVGWDGCSYYLVSLETGHTRRCVNIHEQRPQYITGTIKIHLNGEAS